MVKNPLSNAGDMGPLPGPGTKIPHATTAEPVCPRTCVPRGKPLHAAGRSSRAA